MSQAGCSDPGYGHNLVYMHNLFQDQPGNGLITAFLQEIDSSKINVGEAVSAIVLEHPSGSCLENEHTNHHQPT